MTYASLQPYDRERPDMDFALSRKSFQELIEYAGYSVPLPVVRPVDVGSRTVHPPRDKVVAKKHREVDQCLEDVSSSTRSAVTPIGETPSSDNTAPVRREEATLVVVAAQTRRPREAELAHIRHQSALEAINHQRTLERFNKFRSTDDYAHTPSHNQHHHYSNRYITQPTERQCLLPIYRQDSYRTPGRYRYYGSTTLHPVTGDVPWLEEEERYSCFGTVFRSFYNFIRGCFSLLCCVPWGKGFSLIANLLIWAGLAYGIYRLGTLAVNLVKDIWMV